MATLPGDLLPEDDAPRHPLTLSLLPLPRPGRHLLS